MKNKILHLLFIALLVITPAVSFAQSGSSNSNAVTTRISCSSTIKVTDVQSLIKWCICTITDLIIPLLFMLAFAYFLWGVVKFIRDGDNEKARTEGRKTIIYGIISLAVIVSVWGIIGLARQIFGVDYTIPQVQDTKFK